jgi:hypothetical protein
VHFSDLDIHRLVAHYLAVRFPTCLALNKVDELGVGGEETVRECQRMAAGRGEVAVPVSARAECRVLQRELEAQGGQEEGQEEGQQQEQQQQEERVLRETLLRWGGTGVLEAISAAVRLNPPVLCYPVGDLDSEAPLGWSAHRGAGAAAGAYNDTGTGPAPPQPVREGEGERERDRWGGGGAAASASVAAAPRLQDCLQLKPRSTVLHVFEALKNSALANVQLHGDFVRAEGKSLQGGGKSKRQQLRRDQVVDNQNCVLRILTNKKHSWQKDHPPHPGNTNTHSNSNSNGS